MADLARVQFLHLGWKRQIRVELTLGEQLQRFEGGVVDQGDVLFRVEPDIGCDHREQPSGIPELAYVLPFQVGDAADAAMGEQLITAGMHASDDGDWQLATDRDYVRKRQV